MYLLFHCQKYGWKWIRANSLEYRIGFTVQAYGFPDENR